MVRMAVPRRLSAARCDLAGYALCVLHSAACRLGWPEMTQHTITIALSKEEAERFENAHTELHYYYGIALANWSGIERGLFYWFYRTTAMSEAMARAVFYSARSFNGRAEMLDAAVAHNPTIVGDELAFIKAAIKKAGRFSSFRNRIAHGEPIINVIELKEQGGNQASRTIDCSIVQGKSHGPDPATDVPIKSLTNAAENFHRLQCLLADALGRDKPHAKYLEQLRKLPSQADALTDRGFSQA